MSLGQFAIIIGVFSSVWAGSMFVVNSNVSLQIHELGDTLRADIQREVGKYQNIYTAAEILELADQNRVIDNQDLKNFIITENKKIKNFITIERNKYDTIYFEDLNGVKFMELGYMIDNKFYLLKEVKIQKFPFE